MDINNFSKEYNSKPINEIYPLIKELFQKKLTKEFLKKFDPINLIIKVLDDCKKFKRFERLFEFSDLIKTNNPAIFIEAQQYIDDDLIDYYLYNQQTENLEEPINNFISNPVKTIVFFLQNFNKLIFYQYNDLADKMITKSFAEIHNSSDLLSDSSEELKRVKFISSVENMIEKKGKVDYQALKKQLKKFDIEPLEEFVLQFNQGFENISKNDLLKVFQEDKETFLQLLEVHFLFQMKHKKFLFPLSSLIINNMFVFWMGKRSNKKQKNPDKFFSIKRDEFDEFLGSIAGGLILNNFSEVIATLWGSYYVYDFLKSIGLINEDTHKSSIEIITGLKKDMMKGMKKSFWQYAYVAYWIKPESMSTKEFNKENALIKKSYSLIPKETATKKDMFSLNDIETNPFFQEIFNNVSNIFEEKPKKPKSKKNPK